MTEESSRNVYTDPLNKTTSYPAIARALAKDYYNAFIANRDNPNAVTVDYDQVYIVWFAKTLPNWKALVGITNPDGVYFEITHNGDKKETYIDYYKKLGSFTYSENSRQQ